MNLCSILDRLFPNVSRLALDAGVSSWSKVRQAAVMTGLSEDDVIATKCRLLADTLAYLLSYQPYQEGSMSAWWIRIRGLNHFNQPTSVGHALIVVETEEGYLLIDGYIGCRNLTCRYIDFDEFKDTLERLQDRYDPQLWIDLTECAEKEIPDHCKVMVHRYSYQGDLSSIQSRLQELELGHPDHRYGHKND